MVINRLLLLSCYCITILAACTSSQPAQEARLQGKLEKLDFNIDGLDKDGLIGPERGKVSVDYQFCIPSGKEIKHSTS